MARKKKIAKSKIKKYKSYFEDEYKKIIDSINKQIDDEIDIDGDETDIVQGNLISSISSYLSNREIARLKKIKSAMKKIEDGTFGICESCDEPIGEKRLKAMPEISICIDCAEEEERLAKRFAG